LNNRFKIIEEIYRLQKRYPQVSIRKFLNSIAHSGSRLKVLHFVLPRVKLISGYKVLLYELAVHVIPAISQSPQACECVLGRYLSLRTHLSQCVSWRFNSTRA
jgi:hypothetical protein